MAKAMVSVMRKERVDLPLIFNLIKYMSLTTVACCLNLVEAFILSNQGFWPKKCHVIKLRGGL